MPRNVRNFWIELEVDGKKTPIATGPVSADGGFNIRIRMRNKGDIYEKYVYIKGSAQDGRLLLTAESAEGSFAVKTER